VALALLAQEECSKAFPLVLVRVVLIRSAFTIQK